MSGARPDTWMPWFIGDYLADTMHLTRDQHGGYLLLIAAYWRRGGSLPDDDGYLAAITKASVAEWKRLRSVLAAFFLVKDGVWAHKRIDAELARAAKVTEQRSRAGQRGGESARGKSGRKPSNECQRNDETTDNGMADEIANELQKNTPSPPPPQERYSVADATAAIAALTPHDEVWGEGIAWITDGGKTSRNSAGSFLGKQCSKFTDAVVLAAIRTLRQRSPPPVDPKSALIEYLTRPERLHVQSDSPGKPSPNQTLHSGFDLAIAAREGRT